MRRRGSLRVGRLTAMKRGCLETIDTIGAIDGRYAYDRATGEPGPCSRWCTALNIIFRLGNDDLGVRDNILETALDEYTTLRHTTRHYTTRKTKLPHAYIPTNVRRNRRAQRSKDLDE